MSIEVTDELVARIASLARLSLSEAETAEIRGHFEKVLHFVESLGEVDTEGVDPSIFTLDAENVLEPDVPHEPLGTEGALKNGPSTDEECFLVPRIIAEGGESPEES